MGTGGEAQEAGKSRLGGAESPQNKDCGDKPEPSPQPDVGKGGDLAVWQSAMATALNPHGDLQEALKHPVVETAQWEQVGVPLPTFTARILSTLRTIGPMTGKTGPVGERFSARSASVKSVVSVCSPLPTDQRRATGADPVTAVGSVPLTFRIPEGSVPTLPRLTANVVNMPELPARLPIKRLDVHCQAQLDGEECQDVRGHIAVLGQGR